MLITIDGPSGVGKGTVARAVSYKLGFSYLDSGAMYRALALYADLKNIKEDDDLKLKKLLIDIHIQFVTNDEGEDRVFLNTDDVTEDIRSNEISQLASKFAKIELVRNVLTEMQKRLVKNKNYITEGRDMGTYVFPDADYKFYLEADPIVRAERRSLQLTQTLGMKFNPQKILEEINQRDNLDKTRKICPLHPADDAIIIDTTNLSVIDVVENIINRIK
ncbi:cytidylate kinase [bacterium]|nr:(d)CMP kinase [bacterium]GIR28549.1 MAG: cytidylate kinase [bacterium]|tara:strand:- start:1070 stop:1726 length:657 start_codon:yes stop_codon:yes gene_type:complete